MSRILFLLHEPYGSLGNAASFFYPEQVALHHNVLVVSPSFAEGTVPVNYPQKASVHWVGSHGLWKRWMALRAVIRAFDPDIVHMVYNPRLLPIFFADLLQGAGSRAWIADIRSPLQAEGLRRPAARLLSRNSLPRFDRLLVHAPASLQGYGVKSETPYVILPPGIDTAHLPQCRPAGSIQRFVYIGSITAQRNLEVLLHGFARLVGATSDPVTLDLYGEGPERCRLEILAGNMGLENRVRFQGVLPQQELHATLPSYDCGIGFVPATQYNDVPTLKVLEYAAVGLPILASDTGFHRQWQGQGLAMHLFENTPESFASRALDLMRSTRDQTALKRNACFARSRSWECLTRDILLPVYTDLATRIPAG
jgi:glycosyltransferase involved in cell wall biosynthesis